MSCIIDRQNKQIVRNNIVVIKLYLSYLLEDDDEGTPLKLNQPDNFGPPRLSYTGPTFHFACQHLSYECIQCLLNFDIDINAVDVTGKTALHLVFKAKTSHLVESILTKNPNINKIALDLAIKSEYYRVIELLLKNKADVNLKDLSGKTALHLALENPHITINSIKSILISTNDINATDNLGRTAIHYAAFHHKVDILRHLLQNNANVNARDFDGKTPFHVTMNSRDNCFQCVEVLLDYQADINAVDNNLVSPLHLACFVKNAGVVKYLIENGADSRIRDKDGKTIFHYACMDKLSEKLFWFNGKMKPNDIDNILIVLLEENISVNCVDNLGKTPLHYAAVNDKILFLNKLLLNIGADINIMDKNHNLAFDELIEQKSDMRYDSLGTLYKKHIVKMKVLKLWVREKILDKIYNVDEQELERIQFYENICSKEINSMKTIIVGKSDITYYDFLKKSSHEVVNYTRNPNIVKYIQSRALMSIFPEYGHFLKFHLQQAQRRRSLYEQIEESLNICRFKQLPTFCIYEILKYLDHSELAILLEAMDSLFKKNYYANKSDLLLLRNGYLINKTLVRINLPPATRRYNR